ncbi:hypothetical protein BG000_001205, partial [Podila horticola]
DTVESDVLILSQFKKRSISSVKGNSLFTMWCLRYKCFREYHLSKFTLGVEQHLSLAEDVPKNRAEDLDSKWL